MHRTLPSAVAAGLAVAALTLLPASAAAQNPPPSPQKTDTVKRSVIVVKSDSAAKKPDTLKVTSADSVRVFKVQGTGMQLQIEPSQLTPGSNGQLQGVIHLDMGSGTSGGSGGIKLSSDSTKKAGTVKPDSTAKGKPVGVRAVEVKPAESKSTKKD